jgi:hypothetical protein
VPAPANIIDRVTAPDKEWTMPQARSAGSNPNKQQAKRASAKAAAKPAAAKSAAAKPASAAKSAAAKSTAAKPAAKRTAATAKSAAAKRATAAKPAAKRTAATASTAKPAASKAKPRVRIRLNADGAQIEAQIEAIAERLRKLNEKIIEVGREAGESRLTSYEKALKTIATGISQGPAKDELEWIQHLAASQAKFVREITESWAKAARDRLK